MRFITTTDLMNLTGKSLTDVLKKMGNPDDKEKNGLSINLNYRDKNVILTFEIFAGKIKSSSIIYTFYNKATLGSKFFKLKLELIKAGFEMQQVGNKLVCVNNNIKINFQTTANPNNRRFTLGLMSVLNS